MDSKDVQKKPAQRLKMQVRFSRESNFQPGLITDISTTGLTLLCREKPTDRTVTLSLTYQSLATDVVCEAMRKETVDIHGHTLNKLILKIVAAPLSYLDIVDSIEAQQTKNGNQAPATNSDDEEEILELLPEDLEDLEDFVETE